ncbi:methyltransferase type 11 [Chloroflexus islandicus]|uniref:Methyltransferase type 11 n=1 Tax=Chloroflexus islandicus TaxID=1707952 RepID=A0A178MKE4_9CHLR|nr:class I SAM-dependent methyltransferase [Chloroflexus islandicus]OAN48474.1 methyltransferase type 11 [Chloroflexus islandicus]
MNLPEYEYRGLIAEAWDVLRGDTSNWADRHFYLAVIRQYGQPVLDVGCGTGRLLLDYMQQGIDIDGVDNSPEMLAICRHKADQLHLQPALYEQYLECLALPRKYQTMLVPSSSLQLITDLAAVEQVMARLYEHVLPGGVIVASFMTLWQAGEPLTSEEEQTAVRAADGVAFRRVARTWFDPVSDCEHTEDVYQKIIDGHVVEEALYRRSPATRSYSQSQARALFERAGFQHVRLLSGFTNDAAKPEDRLFTVMGHKPLAV